VVRWGREASTTDRSHEDGGGAVDAVLVTRQDPRTTRHRRVPTTHEPATAAETAKHEWSVEHQLQITTTICPTRSVLTVPDGPDRPIEMDDDALRDLDLSCELATTALPLNGGARPASPTLGRIRPVE
jgi:hypothetical protein